MRDKERQLRPIQGLFAKYQRTLQAPQTTVTKTFVEVVDDVIGFAIPLADVSYSVAQKTLTLKVSGVLRSEVKLHEEEILHHMKGRLGAKSAPKKIL